MPTHEVYLEVGTLEGRTLEAAAAGNASKLLYGCDPCTKYDTIPKGFTENVRFFAEPWQNVLRMIPLPIGVVFYDGDHSTEQTLGFMDAVIPHLSSEAVLVLDDWDRTSVREAAFNSCWTLLREMPEYTDGLTCAPNHFGYYFGVSLWGYKK